MANFFYIDANGNKQGPYDKRQLEALSEKGIIEPTTLMVTDTGDIIIASKMPGFDWVYEDENESLPGIPDIGFAHFVTPALITITWWLSIGVTICSSLCMMYQISSSLLPDGAKGFGVLVMFAIAIYSLLITRIILEYFAIQFRMERHQRTIKEILEKNVKTSKPQS